VIAYYEVHGFEVSGHFMEDPESLIPDAEVHIRSGMKYVTQMHEMTYPIVFAVVKHIP